MAILTESMKKVVREQRLGYVATVCADGTPNLSPKGTTNVWDDEHLIFADICSPGTIENLLHNPAIEINVVDPIIRKGYRFKGFAEVLAEGELFDKILSHYKVLGVSSQIKRIVLVKVERALPIISPVYDAGLTEEEVKRQWETYWNYVSLPPKQYVQQLKLNFEMK